MTEGGRSLEVGWVELLDVKGWGWEVHISLLEIDGCFEVFFVEGCDPPSLLVTR